MTDNKSQLEQPQVTPKKKTRLEQAQFLCEQLQDNLLQLITYTPYNQRFKRIRKIQYIIHRSKETPNENRSQLIQLLENMNENLNGTQPEDTDWRIGIMDQALQEMATVISMLHNITHMRYHS